MSGRITVTQGDITTFAVDAIVNAANNSLLGGGGVDGAIHRGAGPALLAECRTLNGCPTGEAKITGGYDLPAKHVIHTVGPIWRGGDQNERELLVSCYRESLRLAHENHLETVCFPSISTGAYSFPIEQAAAITIEAISAFLAQHDLPGRVTMVCFSDADQVVYQQALQRF